MRLPLIVGISILAFDCVEAIEESFLWNSRSTLHEHSSPSSTHTRIVQSNRQESAEYWCQINFFFAHHFSILLKLYYKTLSRSKATIILMAADKVKVHFVAVGRAPLLKKSKFQISADQPFGAVTQFLRKLLKMDTDSNAKGNSLFLYLASAFVPSPGERIGDLQTTFAVRDELVIHYSLQEAWG